MDKEKIKTALVEAFQTGWYEGYADACDTIMPALIEAAADVVAKLKESAQEVKAEAIDELEGVE